MVANIENLVPGEKDVKKALDKLFEHISSLSPDNQEQAFRMLSETSWFRPQPDSKPD